MTTKRENTNIPPKPDDTISPTKEFFNFLFNKRIGKALGWVISKIDDYLSDDTPPDGRTSRVAEQNPNDDFTLSHLGAWASAAVSGLKMLLIPAKKLYQYIKWRKDPTRKKPVFTSADAFYLAIDVALFALTVTAVALASSFASVIIGFAAACITIVSGVVEFVHAWKNSKNNSMGTAHATNTHYFHVAKRTVNLTLPLLGVVAAGLVLLGTVLGPVGIPLITVGVGIGIGVAIIGAASWIAQKVDNYIVKQAHQRRIDHYLLEGTLEKDTSLTLSEKIKRMFEIQRFLSEHEDFNDKKYQKFFKNAVLVRALSKSEYRHNFKETVRENHFEVSRELLKTRPLSEKKEIPLDIIVDHVIQNPEYAKTILSKRYGTVLLGRRNFRKELSERVDLVIKLKEAADENPVLAEAIAASKLENSRHFKKIQIPAESINSPALRYEIY